VALANIEVIEQTQLIQHIQDLAQILSSGLEKFKSLSHVGNIRQRGLMVGIELVRNKRTKKPYTLEETIGHQVISEARRHGLIIRPSGNVIVLMPVLAMSEEQLQQVISITYEAIKNVTEGSGNEQE